VHDLVVVVPMLGRAHRVDPLVTSLRSTTPGARLLLVLNPNDVRVQAEADRCGVEWIPVRYGPVGDYARKINTGAWHTTEPLIFTGADDLRFHPGWFEAARSKLGPGVGVVGTNDLGSQRVMRGEHSTHSLITRAYMDEYGTIDEPGKILHEGYPHEYVDDELIETAKYRGAFRMALDAHVEHLHPNWGKAPSDVMYQQQQKRMWRGRPIFMKRRGLWT
jgi:hypothetical protein